MTLMLRLLLKLTLIVSALFALAIGVIHPPPFNESDLRDFFFDSPGCENYPDNEPCFMGIRPDATTLDEAIAILEKHEWVEQIRPRDEITSDGGFWWYWSGHQPAFINETITGIGYLRNNTVTFVSIQSTIPLVHTYVILGLPSRGHVQRISSHLNGEKYLVFSSRYNDLGIDMLNQVECPVLPQDFWPSVAHIYFESTTTVANGYNDPRWGYCIEE